MKIFWREDCGLYRVWRSDWASDQFQVIDYAALKMISHTCELMSIPFREAED